MTLASHRASYHGSGHHDRERGAGPPIERHRSDNYNMHAYDADDHGEPDGYEDDAAGYEHHEHHSERHGHR
jgi:hypothetical protein